MPELPEVEVCRRGLLPELIHRSFSGALIRQGKLRHPVNSNLSDCLQGQEIYDIERRGKYLLIHCRNGSMGTGSLLIHLGMSGNLRFVPTTEAAGKHDHVDLILDNIILRYGDPRRFGMVLWIPGTHPTQHPLLNKQGIEPFSETFTGGWLYEQLRNRSSPIKPVLMDNHLVVGIGNIYASESLFRAGISPIRQAKNISKSRCTELVKQVRETLQDAIDAGGSSIRDYIHSDGGAGCFQVDMAVYERAGMPCRRCQEAIRQIRQAGRSTYYCPACQR